MQSLPPHLSFAAALLVSLLAGCTTAPVEPRSVLDENTGVSLTVVDQPLVLARERRDVAVQARDYVTLVAVEINESGRRRLIWVAHQWSTIDARATDIQPTPGTPLLLIADGRDLRLVPVGDAGITAYTKNRALLTPPDADAVTTAYTVDSATLEFVATSRTLAATYPESRLALPFSVWKDGRPALARLLERIGTNN